MNGTIKNSIKLFANALAVFLLFSCESNFKEVQKSTIAEFVPSGEADSINIKYTDSGRIKSILISSKMLDYSSVSFPFTEFPKGILVTLYDKSGKKTFVSSKYAVSFKNTNIIDLRGAVKITNETGQVFETEQLYFDKKNEIIVNIVGDLFTGKANLEENNFEFIKDENNNTKLINNKNNTQKFYDLTSKQKKLADLNFLISFFV